MKYFALLPLVLLANAPADTSGLEDIAALDRQLAVSSQGRAMPLDRRLRLVKCLEGVVFESSSPDFIVARCSSLGWRTRVLLNAPLEVSKQTRPIIARGDAVEITYEGDDFDASSAGVALDSGATGEAIRVKAGAVSGTLSAVVVGAGQVKVAH
jgi:Chaperone for flagella basal body P-ring formation